MILDLLTPPQKMGDGGQENVGQNEEEKSSSKLSEMARKLVENDFRIFRTPHPPTKKGEGEEKHLVKNENNQSCL